MSYLDSTPNEETKLEFLQTLRDVTAGKIYVELQRARLTRTLADIREKNGDIDGAASIMQEMQVETFGEMERAEKFEFILEQMRLCMDKNDFIRAAIIAKKILPKQLSRPELKDIKMRFLWVHDSYSRKKQRVFGNLPCLPRALRVLPGRRQNRECYPFKAMDSLPVYVELLKSFLNQELIRWDGLKERFSSELSDVVKSASEESKDELAAMVSDKKALWAKIDRPAQIVSFSKPKDADAILNGWASNVTQLLDLVERTCHLVHRETMVDGMKVEGQGNGLGVKLLMVARRALCEKPVLHATGARNDSKENEKRLRAISKATVTVMEGPSLKLSLVQETTLLESHGRPHFSSWTLPSRHCTNVLSIFAKY
eukprot:IDg6085t1